MAGMASASRALSSLQQYATPWRRFVAFCEEREWTPLPAAPLHVALFLTLTAQGARSYAVVKTASAAIFAHHDLACAQNNPTKHPLCKAVRAGCKRTIGVAVHNRKEPLSLETVTAAVELLLTGDTPPPHKVMLAAFTATCFAGFLRYDDAARLLTRDVRFFPDHAVLFLEKRKNDQVRSGNLVYLARGTSAACPVALLDRHIKGAALAPAAPLFQGFDGQAARRGGYATLNGAPISYQQAHYQVLATVAKVLGVTHGAAQAAYGLHSLRSGGATAAAQSELLEERLFQAHGGWRSREAMLPYLQESVSSKLSVSAALGY